MLDLVEYTAIKYGMVRHRITQKTVTRRFNYDVRELVGRLLAKQAVHDLLPSPTVLMFTQTVKEMKIVRITPAWQRLMGVDPGGEMPRAAADLPSKSPNQAAAATAHALTEEVSYV